MPPTSGISCLSLVLYGIRIAPNFIFYTGLLKQHISSWLETPDIGLEVLLSPPISWVFAQEYQCCLHMLPLLLFRYKRYDMILNLNSDNSSQKTSSASSFSSHAQTRLLEANITKSWYLVVTSLSENQNRFYVCSYKLKLPTSSQQP